MNAMLSFLSRKWGQKQQEATSTGHAELTTCECGCGMKFPKSQMFEIQTHYPEHPIEYVFMMHYDAIQNGEDK
jgi:hypothetical protein